MGVGEGRGRERVAGGEGVKGNVEDTRTSTKSAGNKGWKPLRGGEKKKQTQKNIKRKKNAALIYLGFRFEMPTRMCEKRFARERERSGQPL